jgi:hypothetical protein
MAVNTAPRAPHRKEPHDAYLPPSRSMLWMVVVAAVAAVMFIWVLYAAWAAAPVISVDPNAEPSVQMQPITPPAPVPATRPAPTP